MEKKIKYGVIGVGHLGNFHIKQLFKIKTVDLVGVYDENKQRLDEISKNYSVPQFDSAVNLLKKSDAVSIVTPTTTHNIVNPTFANSFVNTSKFIIHTPPLLHLHKN